MTLEEMKDKVYAMIEEYNEDADDLTEDEDLALKMNGVINQIQNELARHKKIPAIKEIEVTEGDIKLLNEIADDMYQLNTIKGIDADINLNEVIFNETGTAKIYYYKYPTQIDRDTEDDYVFELSTDVLEIMPYGVAGDILKSDVSSQYGHIYFERYRQLLQELDTKYGTMVAYIDGGID